MFKDPELNDHVHKMLDVFTGADGGAEFIFFRSAIQDFEKQASEGDKGSVEIINIVKTFGKLLNILTRPPRGLQK